jgi:hypothetical protein
MFKILLKLKSAQRIGYNKYMNNKAGAGTQNTGGKEILDVQRNGAETDYT